MPGRFADACEEVREKVACCCCRGHAFPQHGARRWARTPGCLDLSNPERAQSRDIEGDPVEMGDRLLAARFDARGSRSFGWRARALSRQGMEGVELDGLCFIARRGLPRPTARPPRTPRRDVCPTWRRHSRGMAGQPAAGARAQRIKGDSVAASSRARSSFDRQTKPSEREALLSARDGRLGAGPRREFRSARLVIIWGQKRRSRFPSRTARAAAKGGSGVVIGQWPRGGATPGGGRTPSPRLRRVWAT